AASLARLIENKRLHDRIRFSGHVENVADYLHAADVFVMPSRSEGFSNALVEALEAGLPCIATRVGIAEDVIEHGHNGFLVERNQVETLSTAMDAILSDSTLRVRLASHAAAPAHVPTIRQYAAKLAEDYVQDVTQ